MSKRGLKNVRIVSIEEDKNQIENTGEGGRLESMNQSMIVAVLIRASAEVPRRTRSPGNICHPFACEHSTAHTKNYGMFDREREAGAGLIIDNTLMPKRRMSDCLWVAHETDGCDRGTATRAAGTCR